MPGENMATLAQLQQAIGNPNVRKMLDLISNTEGTTKNGYNTAFGGGYFDDLSGHPNIKSTFSQTDGKQNITTAAGRYQFLKPTWDSLARQYGFRDFSPKAQDMGAVALLAQNGALSDVLNGDFQSAIKKSGKTWASLPSSPYAQNKKSWDFVNQNLEQPSNSNSGIISAGDYAKLKQNWNTTHGGTLQQRDESILSPNEFQQLKQSWQSNSAQITSSENMISASDYEKLKAGWNQSNIGS